MRNPPSCSCRPPVSPMSCVSSSLTSIDGLVTRVCLPRSMGTSLQRSLVDLARAHANHLGDRIDKDLTVADFTGSRGRENCIHCCLLLLGFHANLDEHLRHEPSVELRSAIARAVAQLLPIPFAVAGGGADDAFPDQRRFDRIELVGLHDRFN